MEKKARILKSNDYGKTWEVYNTPIVQGKGPQGIYSLDFYDMNHGIIVGGDYSKPLENTANKAITSDGGETWTLVSDAQTPIIKVVYNMCRELKDKKFLQWVKRVFLSPMTQEKHGKRISKEGYYAIQFVNKNTAWLSGNNKIGKLVLKQ